MATKSRFSFLIAFTRQLQEACDEGLEEAYLCAESIDAALSLILPPESDTDGPGVDEVDDADSGCSTQAAEESAGDDPGSEDSQPAPDLHRVVRSSRGSQQPLHSGADLLGRTGGRNAAGMIQPPMKRRVPSGT